MMALQAELERDFLEEEPLPMALKRGRKPGSKVKKLKDGSRVVVTGRAAAALARREEARKEREKVRKAAPKAKAVKLAGAVKRGPGRPRKDAVPATPKRVVRKRRTPATGIIA